MHRVLLLLSLATALLIVLATACAKAEPTPTPTPTPVPAPTPTPTPEVLRGGTIRYISWSPLRNRDPLNEDSWQSDEGLVYDTLLRLGPQGEVLPSIATRWQVVSPTVWRFTVRNDMKFHDGTPLTAEDVAFSVNTIKEQKLLPFNRVIKTIDKANVVDQSTVEVRTTTPDSMFPLKMYYQWVVSKAQYTRVGGSEAFSKEPLGSGPYKWVSWVQGTGWSVEKAPVEHAWRTRFFDKIEATDVAEPATIIAALQSGSVDIAQSRLGPDELDTLKRAGKTVVAHPARIFFYHFDPGRACEKKWPTCDPRVRRAMIMAVDSKTYSETLWKGMAVPMRVPAVPSTPGDRADIPYPYNPEEAKRLLDAAGFPVGADGTRFTLDMYAWGTGTPNLQSLAMQADLTKVGIKTNYQLMEFGTFLRFLNTPAQHVPLLQIMGSNTLSNNYTNLVQWCSNDPAFTHSYYPNAQVWKLNDQFLATADPGEQNKILGEIFKIMAVDDPCYLYVNAVPETWMLQPNIQGFAPAGGAVYFYWDPIQRVRK